MGFVNEKIILDTHDSVELINITEEVNRIIRDNDVVNGLVNISTMHTTSGILINEDESGLKRDMVKFFEALVPYDDYCHDRIDNNARSHLKSLVTSQNQTLPVTDSKISLGTWQSVFFVELDGPRNVRRINITIITE